MHVHLCVPVGQAVSVCTYMCMSCRGVWLLSCRGVGLAVVAVAEVVCSARGGDSLAI